MATKKGIFWPNQEIQLKPTEEGVKQEDHHHPAQTSVHVTQTSVHVNKTKDRSDRSRGNRFDDPRTRKRSSGIKSSGIRVRSR